MDFAKKQLEKYGWKEGQGLGKHENGISEALKPNLKFDNSGVGHDVGEQFTNNWWERVFNSAASNINVQVDDDGVKLKLNNPDSVEISTKSYSVKELKKNKNLQYGSFLKTAKLTENGVESYDVAPPEPLQAFSSLTDEELFAACGGRTAHKGARHGLKLSGKLSRIEKQEKLLLKKMKNVSLTDDATPLEKKMKKIKKHSREMAPSPEPSSSRKKNKKKRKSVSFSTEAEVKYYTPEENPPNAVLDPNSNICDEGIEQDIEDTNSEQNDTHRSFEEVQKNFNDLSKAERKKLKKKRRLEKKTPTEVFIEEVKDELDSKKRKLVLDSVIEGPVCKYSKKKKSVPEKSKKRDRKDKKMMNSIVKSLDSFCRISDDE